MSVTSRIAKIPIALQLRSPAFSGASAGVELAKGAEAQRLVTAPGALPTSLAVQDTHDPPLDRIDEHDLVRGRHEIRVAAIGRYRRIVVRLDVHVGRHQGTRTDIGDRCSWNGCRRDEDGRSRNRRAADDG